MDYADRDSLFITFITYLAFILVIFTGEIDRCLKKVDEGVETFEDIWKKVCYVCFLINKIHYFHEKACIKMLPNFNCHCSVRSLFKLCNSNL